MEQSTEKTKVRIQYVFHEDKEIWEFLSLLETEQKAHPDMAIEAELVHSYMR